MNDNEQMGRMRVQVMTIASMIALEHYHDYHRLVTHITMADMNSHHQSHGRCQRIQSDMHHIHTSQLSHTCMYIPSTMQSTRDQSHDLMTRVSPLRVLAHDVNR